MHFVQVPQVEVHLASESLISHQTSRDLAFKRLNLTSRFRC